MFTSEKREMRARRGEQKARRRIRRYVENFLRVQRSLAMQIALRSVKILMNSLVKPESRPFLLGLRENMLERDRYKSHGAIKTGVE